MSLRKIVFLFAAMLLVAAGAVQAQQEVVVNGGSEDDLRAFISRLLATFGPGGDNPAVYVGQLPPELPFELTLPENTNLLGSVVRQNAFMGSPSGDTEFSEIFLSSDLSPEELAAFFGPQFSAGEWKMINENVNPSSGFNANASYYGSYCRNEAELNLSIDAFAAAGSRTLLTLRVQVPGDAYMCSGDNQPVVDPYRQIPSFDVPEGVSINGSRGPALSYYVPAPLSASTAVSLDSSLGADQILEAYNNQLQNLGWEMQTAEGMDIFGRSLWTFTSEDGETWNAVMVVMPYPTVADAWDIALTIYR